MPTCDLVLEGGGVRGIALVGALQVLEEQGYTFARVAGSSGGSVVGALVAAEMPVAEMADLIRQVDYRKFTDPPRWVRLMGPLGFLGKGYLLLRHGGMYEGEYFREWMSRMLAARGIRTFEQLRVDDPGSSLRPERRYKLVVTASDVTEERLRRLPWDYPELGYQPEDRPVAGAVRASMSIPFFFRAVRLPHPSKKVPTTLVDGAVLSNFPITIFDRTDGQPPRWPTFGIKLTAHDDSRADVRGLFGTFRAIIRTMLDAHDAAHLDDPAVRARTIRIDAGWISSRNFSLTDAQVERLYQAGRAAATEFLRTWDWEDYQRKYGRRGKLPETVAVAQEPQQVRQAPTVRSAAATGTITGTVTGTAEQPAGPARREPGEARDLGR